MSRLLLSWPVALSAVWRRASFSVKFAVVILVAGAVMSIVPFWLAQSNISNEAQDRALDKAGVASSLVQQQRGDLGTYATAIARQLAATNDLTDLSALRKILLQDTSVNQSGDIVGVLLANGDQAALRGAQPLDAADPLLEDITTALQAGQSTAADANGQAWLVSGAQVPSSGATAFVARPVTSLFVDEIQRHVATSADPADVILVRGGRAAAGSSFAGAPVKAGSIVDSPVLRVAPGGGAIQVSLRSQDYALAAQPLGDGFSIIVGTPVNAVTSSLQPILVLVALILVSMLFIVLVVQLELQRPLRRLDRAVAALGRGEFDAPVPTSNDDELSRLGATFEAMRVQLRSTMRATAARASVATELAASQPLETALSRVLHDLRAPMHADAALIVVSGSEMADPFSIVEGVREIDIDRFLSGDGPLGEGYRFTGPGALVASAAPASQESQLGMREFCVAPLRLGKHVHGVLAVANEKDGFLPADIDLVASTAEQVALALERYRFLAVVQRQASIDDLTGLYNHRFLVDYLGQQVALAERLNAPLAILMLDIDHFKALNDTHGHQAGDTALAAFAQTLVNSVRTSDLAARYGGEEFSVVMYNTSEGEARIVAEKIRRAVGETVIELPDGQRLALTVSIGGAAFPEDTDSAKELLALADEALYRAKRSGRDMTCMVSEMRRRRSRHPAVSVVHTPTPVDSGSDESAAADVAKSHRSAQ
ncbi:MAG: diguanylate cyclase [Candidatus Dormibacteraeota bacterium]|nr:diguanylate cyclase [Candidatus Dormibacteraeota bacterium]